MAIIQRKRHYNIGFWPNLNAMRAVYPGWVMRIYSDYNISNIKSEYCEFICKNNDVFWCDSRNLPRLGKQYDYFNRLNYNLDFTVDALKI